MKWIIYWFLFFPAALPVYCQHNIKAINALLQTIYKDDEPGAFVMINRNGRVLFEKGYGIANLQTQQKITSSTHFNIGSVTKQFTAFCIVQLAAKKKLSLQDKIIQYFPGFNRVTGNRISIQHLLTHSSGIIDHYAFTDTNLVKHANDADVYHAVKNTDSTYFAPGSQYRYSNTAYCLLALIIEKISGMPFAQYVQQNIFMPLSMQHARVLEMKKPICQRSYGYEYNGSNHTFTRLDADESIFFSTEGDGGIYVSGPEYLRWFKSLQHPLPENVAVVQQCRSAQHPVNAAVHLSYGYGWFISEKDSATAVYHTGSNGGFRAIVFTIPSLDYMVSIFSNRTGIDLESLVQQINSLLGVTNNSFTKTEELVSFLDSSPNFAPCKKTP